MVKFNLKIMLILSASNRVANFKTLRNTSTNGLKKSLLNKNMVDSKLNTPARKKMKSTTDYIYNTLFLNGENSDLCVTALNKEWKLHKIYLCQSPYFYSMFKTGSDWKESSQSSIQIAIPDENITENALFIAFGSFYKEDIEILPLEVVSVLACASLFSLDGLISQCAMIMVENINFKSVISFYEASLTYGVKSVTDMTLKWLCSNLMTSNNEFFLAELKLSLFEKILGLSDLLIIQLETDLYTLCKKWLYFQFNKPGTGNTVVKLDKNWQKTCNDFFKSFLVDNNNEDSGVLDDFHSKTDETNTSAIVNSSEQNIDILKRKDCLLDKEEFAKYICLFRNIRLQHILTDVGSLLVIYSDRIIPHHWIEPHYSRNWLNTIYIDQDQLSHEFEISRLDFESQCARFGRALLEDAQASWRWVFRVYRI